jgi:coenzyme F420-reducing hydrogenase delta subunit
VKDILAEIGIERERVHMVNLSSAMGSHFADLAKNIVTQIEDLGPNPLKNNLPMKRQIDNSGSSSSIE